MRKLAILTFISLDGVMQAPMMADEDPSDGFARGGWARGFMDEVMPQVAEHAMSEPLELLFGRGTYDKFAAHWPTAEKTSHAEFMNNCRKYVATSTPDTATWNHSQPLVGDVAEAVAELKAQDGPTLQVHGSWGLIQMLLAEDLVDELRLWTFPLTLGRGKRLFQSREQQSNFKLLKTDVGSKGTLMSFYRREHGPQA